MTKHVKLETNKYLKTASMYLLLNLFFFSISYFAIKGMNFFMNQAVILLANVGLSLYIANSLQTTVTKKILYVIGVSLFGTFLGFLLVLSTMKLPGSREHNHIMYDICLPAIRRHYGLQEGEAFSGDSRHDKNGNGKWWYQHLECEENVSKGKGPVFSEEPEEFKINIVK